MPTEATIRPFNLERNFEDALVETLRNHGWVDDVITYPTEEDLIENWMKIIFHNNRGINGLNNTPLSKAEIDQILHKVNACNGNPYETNKLINDKYIQITRDCADSGQNGKSVYLKIFDPAEIKAGQSRYQIVRQPRFRVADNILGDNRGDLMLLINGMPVIHIELKRSGVNVSEACSQIKRYSKHDIFRRGIFSLVQIFVAMTPEKTLYFANPGHADNFKQQYFFHWADFNNNEVTDWREVAARFLSIPMAHQMIGYYTIADDKDKSLKVLRSYQYFAVSKICDRVRSASWDNHQQQGGFIWHTTGSGKTMTSFKSAQIIAQSALGTYGDEKNGKQLRGDADKVVFLLDRVELATQSLNEYRGFAGEGERINDTVNTDDLIGKLLDNDSDNCLIVTSIQKMSKIKAGGNITQENIDKINKKRLVFIVDECHRSVFGEMLMSIKNTFTRALLFGFTGTPIFPANAKQGKKEITTETIFGECLHKYTLGFAIPDHNVLGFDLYKVETYQEHDLRELVAFKQINLKLDERECIEPANAVERPVEELRPLLKTDKELKAIYVRFTKKLKMPEKYFENAKMVSGVESFLPKSIYTNDEHHFAVMNDIVQSRQLYSRGGKFHAMMATQSISQAIEYYNLFVEQHPELNVAAVFDNNIDENEEGIVREGALKKMLEDYNRKFGTTYGLADYAQYKKDVAQRVAHKGAYATGMEGHHEKQIDLLIVVSQMLTGYDSKWVNTLYVDKLMSYVDIIQAFSRTNRLFGDDKPFGIIKYYNRTYTMEQNINEALDLYVDKDVKGLFVNKLDVNIDNINTRFHAIERLFQANQIMNFERLPESGVDRKQFAAWFKELSRLIQAATYQGFSWDKKEYEFKYGERVINKIVDLDFETYNILLQRYRELFDLPTGDHTGGSAPWEPELDTFVVETATGKIDADYINSNFHKFVKELYTHGPGSEVTHAAYEYMCRNFASLSQEDQRFAYTILHDVQSGDLRLEEGKTLADYIELYKHRELIGQIINLCEATGLDEGLLKEIMFSGPTENNLNDNGRFTALQETKRRDKSLAFVQKVLDAHVPPFMLNAKFNDLLKDFILFAQRRKNILRAWFNDDFKYVKDEQPAAEVVDFRLAAPHDEPVGEFNVATIRGGISSIILQTLMGAEELVRPQAEVVDAMFYVINAQSVQSLDGLGSILNSAFGHLFGKRPTYAEKHIYSSFLLTKFEAYLKKLYYLLNDKELEPEEEGENVSWKDVVVAIEPIRKLKYCQDDLHHKLFQHLENMKQWRNLEAHVSTTAPESLLDYKIKVAVTLYAYAAGSCMAQLEANGHNLSAFHTGMGMNGESASTYRLPSDDTDNLSMAAEDENEGL